MLLVNQLSRWLLLGVHLTPPGYPHRLQEKENIAYTGGHRIPILPNAAYLANQGVCALLNVFANFLECGGFLIFAPKLKFDPRVKEQG